MRPFTPAWVERQTKLPTGKVFGVPLTYCELLYLLSCFLLSSSPKRQMRGVNTTEPVDIWERLAHPFAKVDRYAPSAFTCLPLYSPTEYKSTQECVLNNLIF